MLKYLFLLFAAVAAAASPLHVADPDYRGAFILPAAANATGATAKYSTQLVISNLSDHPVSIRLELYSNSGYREGMLVNTLPPSRGTEVYGFWGGKQANWEYTDALGTDTMGALRVVAVTSDGAEDPTAVLHGYGRLWIEPASGGRMSEYVPGLTDYEAVGGLRRQGLGFGWGDSVPFIINPVPFARELTDRTYGGARMNIAFVNFDREHEATFSIPERNDKNFWGNQAHSDRIEVTVPPGSTRQVSVPLLSYATWQPNPLFPNDNPLELQVFTVGHSGGGAWTTYASLIDGTTSASTLILDPWTSSR